MERASLGIRPPPGDSGSVPAVKRPTRPRKSARKPSQERALATVEVILEAAARILERDGLGRSFGTNHIAREAGVSIGSLYEYFDGRDAIVRALCERHLHGVKSLIDSAFVELRHAPMASAIHFFIEALFALHGARPTLHRTLHHELPHRLGLQGHIDTDRYIEDRLVDWLLARTPNADPEALRARAFIATRAARAVTVHVFAESLPEARKTQVQTALKELLVRTLDGP